MKKICLLAICSLLLSACGEKNKDAKLYFETIRTSYQAGDYETVKLKIDSIRILFPKAFEQIKESMALLQEVRKAENTRQIAVCDSLVAILAPQIDSIKKNFVYDINKEYQETGRFLPKGVFANPLLTAIGLRSGVNEDGSLFLESVFIGGNRFHNQVSVSTKDGYFAETLPVDGDGLNFRFTDAGKQYEVIKFSGSDENNVAQFIYAYYDKPLTITLKGKNTTSFTLSNASKKAISDSYLLSVWMQQSDSLKNLKEKSELLIRYLDVKESVQQLGK